MDTTGTSNFAPFTHNIFRYMFLKEFFILIQISLKFVPKVPIDNKSLLVHVMAWFQAGDEPFPEPVMT